MKIIDKRKGFVVPMLAGAELKLGTVYRRVDAAYASRAQDQPHNNVWILTDEGHVVRIADGFELTVADSRLRFVEIQGHFEITGG